MGRPSRRCLGSRQANFSQEQEDGMPCREWHDVVGCAALTATIGVCTWLATPVQARPVAPGEFIDPQLNPLTGVSLAEDPDLVGSIIADLTVPFSDGLVLMGTIRTFVVRETTTGTLDFYYEMNPVTDEFIINGFGQFTTDVDWRTDLGTGARGAGRSIDGDELTFSMPAGGPTFVKTDATSFALRGEFVAFAD